MIEITPEGRRLLMQLLERRGAWRATPEAGRRPDAPGRFLRLHAANRTGLLGVVLDRPRATDRTVELGGGEFLLIDETLARSMDGFVLDRDERGSISIRTAAAGERRRRPPARRLEAPLARQGSGED